MMELQRKQARSMLVVVVWPNLSKFHVVFSSSALIRLYKDTFEGHLCQTVNNFVKQNKSSLLSPLINKKNRKCLWQKIVYNIQH